MLPHHSPCGKTSRHLRFNRFFPALPIPKQPFLHSLELNQAGLCGRETRSLEGNCDSWRCCRPGKEDWVHCWTPHACHKQRSRPSRDLLDSTSSVCVPRATTTAPARSWMHPRKFPGRERQLHVQRSSRGINAHFHPPLSPPQAAVPAAHRVISSCNAGS